jgi:IS30 family transposase
MMECTQMARRQVHAAEMLPLLKRHEIQVLLRAGHSQRDVAERTGVSADTVVRVKREDEVTGVDDKAEHRERRIGRPSKATPFTDSVRAWLAETFRVGQGARRSRRRVRALRRARLASWQVTSLHPTTSSESSLIAIGEGRRPRTLTR